MTVHGPNYSEAFQFPGLVPTAVNNLLSQPAFPDHSSHTALWLAGVHVLNGSVPDEGFTATEEQWPDGNYHDKPLQPAIVRQLSAERIELVFSKDAPMATGPKTRIVRDASGRDNGSYLTMPVTEDETLENDGIAMTTGGNIGSERVSRTGRAIRITSFR